ncbi:unnamed protein product [Calypogeia fissa]
MEVDMHAFDCEMRLEDFENYMMLNEPGCEDSDLMTYHCYGEQHVDTAESWHDTLANAGNVNGDQRHQHLQHQRLLYIQEHCSPSLSRSSSHVSSTGSESSSWSGSFGGKNGELATSKNPRAPGFTSGQMTDLCSPLSELTRSSSSSLQSLDSDELDDSHGLSGCDMVVHSNGAHNRAHHHHQTVTDSQQQQQHLSIHGTDLSSLMDSMLCSGVGMADLGDTAVNDGLSPYYEDWSLISRGQHSIDEDSSKPELYGSSPISPLDFSDEHRVLSPQASQAISTTEHDDLSQDTHHHQSKFGSNSGHLHQLLSSSSGGGNEVLNSAHKDFFYHHLSSQISFESCHRPSENGFEPHLAPHLGVKTEDDLTGIRLVHLLLAGAEAVAGGNVDLATVILVRLKELVSRSGSTMQRVAAYFSEGLQYRIEGVKGSEKAFEPQNESLSAFQVMHEVSPYIKFGHFTANQAILEAFEGERRVHIMDYDILEGIQWPSFMQALACRPGGPPHLRITAVCRPHIKRALAMTQETGKRLTEFAASFSIPFSFHQIRIDNEEEFRPTLLKQVKGECLAVNCMLHLPHMPHRSTKAVASFTKVVQKLNPRVFTLVEEELSCSAPTFVGHFFEALHHYSAIFESLEATLSIQSKGRQLIERIFLAPRITNLLTSSCCNSSTGQEGAAEPNGGPIHWHSLAQAAGFHNKPISVYNLCQAKLLLGLFNEGYKVEEENQRLLLSWRSKPLMAASVWQCSPP